MTHPTPQRSRSMLIILVLIVSCCIPHISALSKSEIRHFRRRHGILEIPEWRRRLDQEEPTKTHCEPIGACEMCTDAERSEEGRECQATGRHMQYKCTTTKGEEEISTSFSYKSCSRTEADEEFLMMRLQAICFTIGVLSLFSVRRNKTIGASLFDQRKAAAKQQQEQNSLSLTENNAVEQEMVPLAADTDSLDVV